MKTIIRLKSVATNYNYRTNNLKSYFLELKEYFRSRLCDETGSDIDVNKVNENSYIEIKLRNSIFELQFIAEKLGHDLIYKSNYSKKDILCFMIYDDYME